MFKVVNMDGNYHVISPDGTISDKRKLTGDGYVYLTDEAIAATNRKLISCKLVDNAGEEGLELTVKPYKEPRKLGNTTGATPNSKLITYLSAEEQAEYESIINEAREAKIAAKGTELTEIEKLQLKVKKAQIAVAKAEAEAAGIEYVAEETDTTVNKGNALVDYIPDHLYSRYEELLDIATNNKANAPKVSRPKGPQTPEQKKKSAETRLAKAQAALEALLAAE